MDSIGATALNNPILDNSIIADHSPVLSQKPIFFTIDPLDAVTNVIEEWDPYYSDHETKDDFKQKVKKRKLHGFIGNEYTAEEAMSKQFGPEQIEARAFLEHYWEMKAKCLEAVEKKRNSEVEDFKRHPLFSPNWLVPTRRDIRWHLKNEIGNEEEIVKEKRSESQTQAKQRKEVLRENSSSISYKRSTGTGDLGSSQSKLTERKKGLPPKEIRKESLKENSSSISYRRFTATGDLESSQLTKSRKGIALRKEVVRENSSSISYKRYKETATREIGCSQRKPTESRKGIPLKKLGR